MTLVANITKVKSRITAAEISRQHSDEPVKLIAVSKTRSADDVRAVYQQGITEFGENYLQEALIKIADTQDLPLTWHFIGPIQSNKTKPIAEHFDWVHTVDRIKIATRLNDQRSEPALNICLQVNISAEASKAGCTPDELPELIKAIAQLPKLKLRGLMAIPAPNDALAFQKMQRLYLDLQAQQPNIDTLSMGMSADLETAIAYGATMLRIGTDIFGPRIKPAVQN